MCPYEVWHWCCGSCLWSSNNELEYPNKQRMRLRELSNRKTAEHALIEAGDTSGVGPALANAFRIVDKKVLRAARQDGKDYGSTATVALCFAAHRSLFVAHVGDSRSVLSRCPLSTVPERVLQWGPRQYQEQKGSGKYLK